MKTGKQKTIVNLLLPLLAALALAIGLGLPATLLAAPPSQTDGKSVPVLDSQPVDEESTASDGLTAADWHAIQTQIAAGLPIIEQAKLTASDAASNDQFGYSVSVDGNTAVIGTPGSGDNGAAYIFVRTGTTWSEQDKLTASDGASNDQFGQFVSVDGNTAVIGAYAKDNSTGAAYVFVRTGTTWSEQDKLTASDGATGDRFGWSVAVDGDTAVVGASLDDNIGSAYVFVRTGPTWSQQEKLTPNDGTTFDYFGLSVAVDGDTAIIGARWDDDNGNFSGSAYVYTRAVTTWSLQEKLTPNDGAAGDYFGESVTLDGETAVIGAPAKDNNRGAAYVFVRTGTTWSQQKKLTPSDGALDDRFGHSVSVDGDTAVIGADGDNSEAGAAYVFVRSGIIWNEDQKLIPGDAATDDRFGAAVAVAGETVIVGAYLDDDAGNASGSAYAFAHPGAVLLVDDDDNSPDVLGTYTATLDALGVSYDIWDTGYTDTNEPTAADLAPYQAVVWFTGDSFNTETGPGTASETALGAYLDNGACLLMSSQDYLWAKGGAGADTPTLFMQTYLGLAAGTSDVGNTAVTGADIFNGLGPYTLAYPGSNFSDNLTPDGTAALAFSGDLSAGNAAIAKNDGVYQTVWLGFPFEALPDAAAREAVMRRFTDTCVNYAPIAADDYTLLNDDMENGVGSWTTYGTNSTWTLTTTNPHSGTAHWFAENINTISDQYLEINVPAPLKSDSILSVWHQYDTEGGFDGGVIEISTDFGVNWSSLGPAMTQNGYNGVIDDCCSNPLANRAAFTGDSGGYLQTLIDLSGYAGQNATIRFFLGTDSTVAADGWYIDDVAVDSGSGVYITDEEMLLSTTAPGVLANDSDPDFDSLTAVLDTTTANGALTLNPDGSFTYLPTLNFCGSDSFTYHASDGVQDSNVAVVTIDVNCLNDAPIAVDDEYSVGTNAVLHVGDPGITANDTDPDWSLVGGFIVTMDTPPITGTLVFTLNGTFDYTPPIDYTGSVTFTYHVSDGLADSNIATVTIHVIGVDLIIINDPGFAATLSWMTTPAVSCLYNLQAATNAPYGPFSPVIANWPGSPFLLNSSTGDPNFNNFYYIEAINCPGITAMPYPQSNTVGEFDFAITPGS